MITDILLASFAVIIQFIVSPLSLLPDATLDTRISTAFANVQGYISTMDPIFPIGTLLTVLGIIVLVEFAIFGYKALYWLIKKIPTIS